MSIVYDYMDKNGIINFEAMDKDFITSKEEEECIVLKVEHLDLKDIE